MKKAFFPMNLQFLLNDPPKMVHRSTEDEPVYYDKGNDYSIKIDNLADKVNEGLSEAAEELAKLGSEDRCEHMYLVNLETGELEYYETNHESSSVGYDFWKYLEKNPDKQYAFIHNHNIISSLSETDLVTAVTTPNVPMQIAVQNDGIKYIVQRQTDVPKGFYPDFYFEDKLKELNDRIRSGKITYAESNVERERMVIELMIEEFFGGKVVVQNGKRV